MFPIEEVLNKAAKEEKCDGQRIPGGGGLRGLDTATTESCGKEPAAAHQPSFEAGFKAVWEQGKRQSTDAADVFFGYHSPTSEQSLHMEAVREAAKHFVRIVRQNAPRGSDQTAAIRKIREAVMTLNFAIVSGGYNFHG